MVDSRAADGFEVDADKLPLGDSGAIDSAPNPVAPADAPDTIPGAASDYNPAPIAPD